MSIIKTVLSLYMKSVFRSPQSIETIPLNKESVCIRSLLLWENDQLSYIINYSTACVLLIAL